MGITGKMAKRFWLGGFSHHIWCLRVIKLPKLPNNRILWHDCERNNICWFALFIIYTLNSKIFIHESETLWLYLYYLCTIMILSWTALRGISKKWILLISDYSASVKVGTTCKSSDILWNRSCVFWLFDIIFAFVWISLSHSHESPSDHKCLHLRHILIFFLNNHTLINRAFDGTLASDLLPKYQ